MADLHFGPLTPDLGEVLNVLKIDLGGLLKYLTSTGQVRFCLARGTAIFVELGKVDIQAVKVCRGPARGDSRECACVCPCDLSDRTDKP